MSSFSGTKKHWLKTNFIPDILSVLGILSMAFYMLISWKTIPDSIPSHFGVSAPNAWSSKNSLISLSIVELVFFVLFTGVSLFISIFTARQKGLNSRKLAQLAGSKSLMSWMKLEVVSIFLYIQYASIQVALKKWDGLGSLFLPLSLVIVFGTLALYLFLFIRSSVSGR